jgi:hypothetical protein
MFTRPKVGWVRGGGGIVALPWHHLIKKGEPSDRALMARIIHTPRILFMRDPQYVMVEPTRGTHMDS